MKTIFELNKTCSLVRRLWRRATVGMAMLAVATVLLLPIAHPHAGGCSTTIGHCDDSYGHYVE